MSIHKYPSKKAKNGYLYFVKIYMVKDSQRADHIKRGFRTRKEAKDYEARLIYLKASGSWKSSSNQLIKLITRYSRNGIKPIKIW